VHHAPVFPQLAVAKKSLIGSSRIFFMTAAGLVRAGGLYSIQVKASSKSNCRLLSGEAFFVFS
jgi:hypothetical protein